ncbi:MAG TPA: potassium-transporting ATPase subunit KdpC [Labilithrix sp.]|nr:potassium-transporting ATPase subunit KdpC [Labilithrix sp.]
MTTPSTHPASAAEAPPAPSVMANLARAVGMLAVLTLLTGVVYPVVVTALAEMAFAEKSNGSLVTRDGRVVGSRLIGQSFEEPRYFWGRLSATSPSAYNAASSTGSNLGPSNQALTKAAKARIDALRSADVDNSAAIPVDLVTASASGLDPHISPAAALYQVHRVAQARGVSEESVRELVHAQTEGRTLGVLGEPRVNVLLLNLALDESLNIGARDSRRTAAPR